MALTDSFGMKEWREGIKTTVNKYTYDSIDINCRKKQESHANIDLERQTNRKPLIELLFCNNR